MSYKILIITPSWIGDCVMTQPLLRHLHQLHHDCVIDVFVPKWAMAIYERMPEVHKIIENPFAHGALQLKQRWQMGRDLGKNNYNQVIVLPNSLKSAFIAAATGISKRTGYVGEHRYFLLNDIRKLDKMALPLMVDRYTALAYRSQQDFRGKCDFPQLYIDLNQRRSVLEKYKINQKQKMLVLCAGAEYGTAKRWFPEHFAALARYYGAENWQVILLGSQKDFAISEEIKQLSNNIGMNLCGQTSLSEAIDLLSYADSVVCNDSGLMHLAAAVDVPVVAIYGSSSPKHTPPLSTRARIASLNLSCSPCFKRECPLGHTNCLRLLYPEQVIRLQKELSDMAHD